MKAILVLGVALAITALVLYVMYAVRLQAGWKSFAGTAVCTALLSVPLMYHLYQGDFWQIVSWKTVIMLYAPVVYLLFHVDMLKRAKTLKDDEELL